MGNRFEKVSYEQYLKDYTEEFWGTDSEPPSAFVHDVTLQYNRVKLPRRATRGSAGYDFFVPRDIYLEPGHVIKFPTGIKCKMDHGLVLMMFVRSSVGFKYQTILVNGTGIIDEDYYGNENNEGEIWIKLRNDGDKVLKLAAGDAVAQGIFVPYFVTKDDDTDGTRSGGIGSTGR
jgi:dUTP pyrophosphatase